jgi:chemotaxis protein methyltransferase CheR
MNEAAPARSAPLVGPVLSSSDLAFFATAMRQRTGIVLAEGKAALVLRRLAPRLRETGCGDFAEYRVLLADPEAPEWTRVVELLTTNHSRFFREIHHFKLLARHLDALLAAGATRLRLWSAACASGQEPYSMALVLHDRLAGRRDIDARILATDIDRTVLAAAETGLYPPEDVGHLPAFARAHMAKADDGTFAVSATMKNYVRFKPHNLVGDDWPMKGPFDAIFCRNMLIYLDPIDQTKVVAKLANLVKPGGILCLGHSEIVRDKTMPLERLGVPSSYARL